MMQHERCSRYGCQFLRASALLGQELPKFQIGDSVCLHYETEADEWHYYQGTVIGCFLAPDGWWDGWWYVIRWTYMLGCDYLPLPLIDDAHEPDLSLVRSDQEL